MYHWSAHDSVSMLSPPDEVRSQPAVATVCYIGFALRKHPCVSGKWRLVSYYITRMRDRAFSPPHLGLSMRGNFNTKAIGSFDSVQYF